MKPTRGTPLRQEEGQSIIMITFLMMVLIVLIALVLDVGHGYAQRRIAQNAADAAALAAATELTKGIRTTNYNVLAHAKQYAQRNGINPDTVTARYFHLVAGDSPRLVYDLSPDPLPGDATQAASAPPDADGVTVDLGKTFDTYFIRVLGRDVMAASAVADGYVGRGACQPGTGEGKLPVAVDKSVFDSDNCWDPEGNGDRPCRIWGDVAAPGNFHWISWDNAPGHTSEQTLLDNLQPDAPGPTFPVTTTYAGPGVNNSDAVREQLELRVGQDVWVPVYDTLKSSGENTEYHIIAWAWFHVLDFDLAGQYKYIEGYFKESSGEGDPGCTYYGTHTVKLRPPMDLSRTIEGRVAYQRLVVNQSSAELQPVDVALVLDTSTSMNGAWGASTKIAAARDALKDLASRLRPGIDRVALLHFPKVNNLFGADGYETFDTFYRPSCEKNKNNTTNWRFRAEVLQDLNPDPEVITTTVSSLGANGGTPIGDAMRQAFGVVSATTTARLAHRVVVLASDGLPNVTTNERWTGYNENATSLPGGCNADAEKQAVDWATEAKAAGVTIYTIAIGSDFSSNVLRAMASPDTDPNDPHFLVVSPADMRDKFKALGTRIANIGTTCTITPVEAAGAGALVTIYKRNADGTETFYAQTTASAAGAFIFRDVAPGTYTARATLTQDGLTYDVLTSNVGGPPLPADQPPSVFVAPSPGVYSFDLALKASTTPTCGP